MSDDRQMLLEMIERFGPVTTLDLLLAEIHRLRREIAELRESAGMEEDLDLATAFDPRQLTFPLIHRTHAA